MGLFEVLIQVNIPLYENTHRIYFQHNSEDMCFFPPSWDEFN